MTIRSYQGYFSRKPRPTAGGQCVSGPESHAEVFYQVSIKIKANSQFQGTRWWEPFDFRSYHEKANKHVLW